tara:strand:+ start:1622 stop:2083 length:462 start_codon:yes stop_codon:yes gene_type:complete
MTRDEIIATAKIAQIFGSELFHAQESARMDSGSTPNFVKVHPRDILLKNSSSAQNYKSDHEKRLMQMLQREAESACPLPPDPINQQAAVPPPVPMLPIIAAPQETPRTDSILPQVMPSAPGDVWERISTSLERIANRLDAVEITLKKKRIRRK